MSLAKVKLGELGTFLNGGTPSRNVDAFYNGHIPWITSADVNADLAAEARHFITNDAIKNSATRLIPKDNLLLVTRTGVGKVAITGVDLCINQDFTAIIPDTRKADLRYLFWFLRSSRSYFEAYRRGATIQGITRKVVENLEVPIPSLEQQKRIAAILDKADELRAKRRRAIAKLDELLKSVFLELFGDPVANPKGWGMVRVETLIDGIEAGASYGGEHRELQAGELGVLKISAVTSGVFKPSKYKAVQVSGINPKIQMIKPRKGNLLFSRANTRELVGAVCVVPQDFDNLFLPDKLWRIDLDLNKCAAWYFKYLLSNRPIAKVMS